MRSPITTHVLDTATGKPAEGLEIVLEFQTAPNRWQELARGKTNADGRISDLLQPGHVLALGVYRMTFDTKKARCGNTSLTLAAPMCLSGRISGGMFVYRSR